MAVAAIVSTDVSSAEVPQDPIVRMEQSLNGSCNYPVLDTVKSDKRLMCELEALRSRCNQIDDCYVYCIGKDVGKDVGGGCAHLCNYGLRKEWAPPTAVLKCIGK
jgi:hypothetical protein